MTRVRLRTAGDARVRWSLTVVASKGEVGPCGRESARRWRPGRWTVPTRVHRVCAVDVRIAANADGASADDRTRLVEARHVEPDEHGRAATCGRLRALPAGARLGHDEK